MPPVADARLQALDAALRALTRVTTPDQAALAAALLRRDLERLATAPMATTVDQATAAEVARVLQLLGDAGRDRPTAKTPASRAADSCRRSTR